MESALYGVYTLVVLYQKSHSFASLTCSISDTPQLVCKHRTRALSTKYSIFTNPLFARHFGAKTPTTKQESLSAGRGSLVFLTVKCRIMIGQMAIAIALLGFNDLGRSTFSFDGSFSLTIVYV